MYETLKPREKSTRMKTELHRIMKNVKRSFTETSEDRFHFRLSPSDKNYLQLERREICQKERSRRK